MPTTAKSTPRRASTGQRRPPEGIKAGNGEYVFELARLNRVDGGPDYSTATGSIVEGERFMMGLMRMPKGTGASPHSHPNEQWVYVIDGHLAFEVDGVKGEARPGSLLYFPPNSVHSTLASADRDVVFLTGKDRSHGLWGIPVAKGSPAQKPKRAAKSKS
jgi:quercetin dioxygenase-like cupin family protein